jgi:hypothetical protein
MKDNTYTPDAVSGRRIQIWPDGRRSMSMGVGSKIPTEVKEAEHASNQSVPNTTSEGEYLHRNAKEDENQPRGVGTMTGPELVQSTMPEQL